MSKFPVGVPAKETGIEANGGSVEDRTYRSNKFSFDITVPENWFIAGADFEKVMLEKGYDLSLNPRDGAFQKLPNPAPKNIEILMTAFRSEPDARDSAILRITAENLKPNPQIKDAVDYIDAITAAYITTTLPADFAYSGTKAEKLGEKQFAYLDTSSNSGKKRLYATVRSGFAIMFTLSYTNDDDLRTFRRMLQTSNFIR